MEVKTKKIKERCNKCGAKWKGDGWTKFCPNCGANQGNM